MTYRIKNKTILAKLEATAGTEETPAVGTDAILVENPALAPSFDNLQTNEVGSSLDSRGPVAGGGYMGMTFDTYLKGAGTAGQAPEYGKLLRAEAFSELLTAADISDTAQGGAAGTITLAATDPATADDEYRGMVIEITGGTGVAGERRVISGFVNSTKIASVFPDWTTPPDATTTYSIRANALYTPASVDLETMTVYHYDNAIESATQSRLAKLIGAAGTASIAATTRGLVRVSHNFRGILPEIPTNVAAPGAPTYDNVRPLSFRDARAFFGQGAVKFRDFSLDFAANVQQADDPSAVFGFDTARQVDRRMTGTLNPLLELKSVRDNFDDWLNRGSTGAARELWLEWGPVGNRVSLYIPEVSLSDNQPADTDGFTTEALSFEASGFDQGVFVCIG